MKISKLNLFELACLMSALFPASFVSGQNVVFSEGFNSDFMDPYTGGFGPQFGLTNPAIVVDGNNGTQATEGDSFAGLNTERPQDAKPTVFNSMEIDLGTVSKAGITYTFTGDFSWRFGSNIAASELRIIGSGQSGFLVEGDKVGRPMTQFYFDMPQMEWREYILIYRTTPRDVGKNITLRIRLADNNEEGGLNQIITDNWKVTVTP